MRQTGNDNLIWHLSCQQDNQIWRIEMNMPENCGFLHNWRMKINFSRQKWKYSKSVFHRLVNLFNVRFLCLIVRPWDCPQNRETWEVCSWMRGGLSEICCLLILNLSAKFVPFSLFSKCEIMVCLSLIEITDCFHCIDMAVIWVYDRTNVESSMTFP